MLSLSEFQSVLARYDVVALGWDKVGLILVKFGDFE
jgi:hypothetical protein